VAIPAPKKVIFQWRGFRKQLILWRLRDSDPPGYGLSLCIGVGCGHEGGEVTGNAETLDEFGQFGDGEGGPAGLAATLALDGLHAKPAAARTVRKALQLAAHGGGAAELSVGGVGVANTFRIDGRGVGGHDFRLHGEPPWLGFGVDAGSVRAKEKPRWTESTARPMAEWGANDEPPFLKENGGVGIGGFGVGLARG
jgi:hypothetical protein